MKTAYLRLYFTDPSGSLELRIQVLTSDNARFSF